MSIAFDTMPPRAPRRSASTSLLNRIQKPPLVERLSQDDSTIKAPSGPYVTFSHFFTLFPPDPPLVFRRGFTGGPVRNRPSRDANNARTSKGPKKPKTAAELDQELDAFMGDADAAPIGDPAVAVPGDVDMA